MARFCYFGVTIKQLNRIHLHITTRLNPHPLAFTAQKKATTSEKINRNSMEIKIIGTKFSSSQNCVTNVKTLTELSANIEQAIRDDNLDMVKSSVERGADIYQKYDEFKIPALVYAAAWHRKDIVEYLIKLGADVNYPNFHGYTALHTVCWSKRDKNEPRYNIEIIELLLKNGADYRIMNSKRKTALDMAIEYNNLECVDAISKYIKSVEKA